MRLIIQYYFPNLIIIERRGNALKWFNSYLTGCIQLVKCGGLLSATTLKAKSGVAYLKTLILNHSFSNICDFKNCLNDSNSLMFADDTSIIFLNNDINKLFDVASKEFELVVSWLITNKL